jgi:hypothetical protein
MDETVSGFGLCEQKQINDNRPFLYFIETEVLKMNFDPESCALTSFCFLGIYDFIYLSHLFV